MKLQLNQNDENSGAPNEKNYAKYFKRCFAVFLVCFLFVCVQCVS